MWFTQKNVKKSDTAPLRTVVCIGGSGMLGHALSKHIPNDTAFINVSRKRQLISPHTTNLRLDVTQHSPHKTLDIIQKHISNIDVLVYAPFMSHYKRLEVMSENEIKKEFELLALRPIGLANAFRAYAEANPQKKNRVFIAIGSGVYKGLPHNRMDLGSYGASKCYLHYALCALAEPFARSNVRTVIIHPGSLTNESVNTQTTKTFWGEACSEEVTGTATIHDIF